MVLLRSAIFQFMSLNMFSTEQIKCKFIKSLKAKFSCYLCYSHFRQKSFMELSQVGYVEMYWNTGNAIPLANRSLGISNTSVDFVDGVLRCRDQCKTFFDQVARAL